jgi:hypothetical protein
MTIEETKSTMQEYWRGFPEAPATDTIKWLDKNGFDHFTTLRAWTGGGLIKAVDEFIQHVIENGGIALPKVEAPAAPPAPSPDTQKIPMTTEDGLPVVDGDGKAVMTNLPDGHHLFTVKEVFHDTNHAGDKHMLKVVLEESYVFVEKQKYGISCFRPESHFPNWKTWEIGKRFSPPVTAAKVIVRDPKPGGKYPDVVEFRPA